jgi:glycosyltransferase involved in cell wall biosynthesis
MNPIYVVMASYLGDYPNCASNRVEKFIRAVDSFLANTYENKILIIVSDGCDKTEDLYNERYGSYKNILLVKMTKQPLFSGTVRNTGLGCVVDSDAVVCYLDTDDKFGPNHLSIIMNNFGDNDFVIYDTYRPVVNDNVMVFGISKVAMQYCHIGTSSFAHKSSLRVSWPDGYGHDWKLLSELSKKCSYRVMPMPEYYIMHTPKYDG